MATLGERSLDASSRYLRGITSGLEFIYKFGFNGDVDTGVEETIWDEGGLYGYIPSPVQIGLSSSSTADTAAGTGARTVRIFGLDENFEQQDEVVTLNGQTAVLTQGTYSRVFRMFVVTAGSGEGNAGVLYAGTGTVTAGVPANVFARISQGENQTLMAVYTVPRNKIGLLFGYTISSEGNASAVITARVVIRNKDGVFRTANKVLILNDVVTEQSRYPVAVDSQSDVELRVVSDTNNVTVSGSFFLMLSG